MAFAAIVCAGIVATVQIRQNAQRIASSNDFRSIAVALQNYSSAHSSLPRPVYYDQNNPNTELYSWRYRIIPYVASYKMDVGYNFPWNHPINSKWLGVPQPYAFGGWGDGMGDTRRVSKIPTETRVYAITGPDTAFGDGKTHEPYSIADLPGDVILAAEIRKSENHWMKSSDFDIQTMPKSIDSQDDKSISGHHECGFYVIFADAEVWFLSNETPFSELSQFFTIRGAIEHDREQVLGKYR